MSASEEAASLRHLKSFFDGMYNADGLPPSDPVLVRWIEDARIEPPTAFRVAFNRVHEIISRKD